METYDPETAPDAAEWLELEEDERIGRVAVLSSARKGQAAQSDRFMLHFMRWWRTR